MLLNIPKEGMSTLDMFNSATGAHPQHLNITRHVLMAQIQAANCLKTADKTTLRLLGVDIDLSKIAQDTIDEYSSK